MTDHTLADSSALHVQSLFNPKGMPCCMCPALHLTRGPGLTPGQQQLQELAHALTVPVHALVRCKSPDLTLQHAAQGYRRRLQST